MSTTQTTMLDAVRAGDLDAVRAMLDADPDAANARDDKGVSAVLAAAYGGRREVLALLLSRGPALDVVEAAMVGDGERLRALLDKDPARVAYVSADGWTALHGAAFFGHLSAVRLLLERGADLHARSRNAMGNTPLHAGMAGPLGLEGIRLLLDHGADANAQQHGGYTALHSAAMHGSDPVASLLLERGADPALPADDGRTAADFAREKGHAALAERLEQASASR